MIFAFTIPRGPGAMTCLNGNSYARIWDTDKLRGRGRYTVLTGAKGGSADTVTLRVLGHDPGRTRWPGGFGWPIWTSP